MVSRKVIVLGISLIGIARVEADDLQDCMRESGSVALEACNRAINSGKYSGQDLSTAYLNRSAEWASLAEYDKCIADATVALKLNPKSSLSYGNRSICHEKKGNIDRAISDADAAIKINPNNPTPYIARAKLHEKKGDIKKAISDYAKAIATKSDALIVNRDALIKEASENLERLKKK